MVDRTNWLAMLQYYGGAAGRHIGYFGSLVSEFTPRLSAERDAGKYLWDVLVGGGTLVRDSWVKANCSETTLRTPIPGSN